MTPMLEEKAWHITITLEGATNFVWTVVIITAGIIILELTYSWWRRNK